MFYKYNFLPRPLSGFFICRYYGKTKFIFHSRFF